MGCESTDPDRQRRLSGLQPGGTPQAEGGGSVEFQSHLDGSLHFLSPERSIEIQEQLGADIIMAFDECPSAGCSRAELESSLALTGRWAHRSKSAWHPGGSSALFGIVQEDWSFDLRRRAIEEICSLDLPGYALGGYSVGERPSEMQASWPEVAPLLPADRPRYLMGVGTPDDLLVGIAAGLDMFDCVLPTRCATQRLALHPRAGESRDPKPGLRRRRPTGGSLLQLLCIVRPSREPTCGTSFNLARAPEAYRLCSIHNLAYYLSLMATAQAHAPSRPVDRRPSRPRFVPPGVRVPRRRLKKSWRSKNESTPDETPP